MAIPSVDKIVPQEYDPRLYAPVSSMTPLDGFSAVDDAAVEQYQTLGVLSIANAFSPEDCNATVQALLELADRDQLPEGLDLSFEALADPNAAALPIEQRQDQIRKYMWYVNFDPRFDIMAKSPEMLAVIEKLLGAEPEMYQEMALFKPPGIGREKPWHQDHAYFNVAIGTPVVGVWIALDEATLENGCMVFQPGGQRAGVIPHFNRRDWQICDSDILAGDASVAAPLPAGGCLIFDGLIPHGTPMNRSMKRRRAVQYHYVPKGTPRITTEERMGIFGDEGRDVSC